MHIVAHNNGVMADSTTLVHDGKSYDGPIFDVPSEVGYMLLERPAAFRVPTADEIDVAAPKKPKPSKKS